MPPSVTTAHPEVQEVMKIGQVLRLLPPSFTYKDFRSILVNFLGNGTPIFKGAEKWREILRQSAEHYARSKEGKAKMAYFLKITS